MDLTTNYKPSYHHTTTTTTTPTTTTSSTPQLFICFNSSSSMKLSKSILSPGHSRDQQQPMSLSTSLSRRLRTNPSLKASQASPIFNARPAAGPKKRGSGFDNPEPSSPKVTCIGQVRVKSKKKGKQMRSLSRRRSGGDGSSRRLGEQGSERSGGGERFSVDCNEKGGVGNGGREYTRANSSSHQQFLNLNQQDCLPHRNQRWVHLPLTICEALRAFGAEFSCLVPCGSSCFGGERGKEEKRGDSREGGDGNGQSSCGALFARWLVTLQDGEGGKEREIELVVGEDERNGDGDEDNLEMKSSRRHVLEDFKISDDIFDGKGRVEEEGRMSICIPPKNALLLMRCKSDPMKMAALTKTRVWDSPPPQEEDEDGDEEERGDFDCKRAIFGDEVLKEIEVDVHKCEASAPAPPEEVDEMVLEIENPDSIEVKEGLDLVMEVQDEGKIEEQEEDMKQEEEDMKQEAEVNRIIDGYLIQETELVNSELLEKQEELIFMEALENQIKKIEDEDINQIEEKEEESCRMSSASFSSAINQVEEDGKTEEVETEEEAAVEAEAETESKIEKDQTFDTQPQLEHQTEDLRNAHENEETKDQEMETTSEVKTEKETENEEVFERRDQLMVENNNETVEKLSSLVSSSPKSGSKPSVLPDCLLLMMYEPKLSMEVSKETWVCSTDFSRWLPQRHKHVKHTKMDDTSLANSDEAKKRTSTDSRSYGNKKSQSPHQAKHSAVAAEPPLAPPTALLPPRSSCSYPMAAVSMAAMIEQKLVNAVGYEPFVLTRCKSEPMRTAGKLAAAQEGCFWTKRKLEPLRRAAYHVGATGVGF